MMAIMCLTVPTQNPIELNNVQQYEIRLNTVPYLAIISLKCLNKIH